MRELEEADNSGCVLNINSRGLDDQADLEGGRKKKIQDKSFLVRKTMKLLIGVTKLGGDHIGLEM